MIGWVDATNGTSGDMLLGACLDAGVPLAAVQDAIDVLHLPITVDVVHTQRGGLAATKATVRTAPAHERRTLGDVLAIVGDNERAASVFRALAEAEARVHGTPVDEVHFHEVGALDSIADVVGVVAALDALHLDRLVCSPIALGGGTARTEHGPIPVPGPAVLELLRSHGAPAFGGPVDVELATPTGVALLVALADEFGPLPSVRPVRVGAGAGDRDPDGHPNVTRLVVGEPSGEVSTQLVLEANVDDLDPRLWPALLSALLDAGASDAWLSPILMKKGRPAHTLSVLADPALAQMLERLVFTHTSSIGVRSYPVAKRALPREIVTVEVYGQPVRVKIARLDGEIVNAVPEYEDVARVAREQGLPPKLVLETAARRWAGGASAQSKP